MNEMNQAAISIISAVISGVLATGITLFFSNRRDVIGMKRKLAADLFGFRYQIMNNNHASDMQTKEFFRALNQVPILFHDDTQVLKAYDNLFDSITSTEKTVTNSVRNEALFSLLKEVCKASNIKCDNWDDKRITGAFNTK